MLTVPTRSCLSLSRNTTFGNSEAAAVPLPVTSVVKENWNLAFITLFRFLFAGSLGRETQRNSHNLAITTGTTSFSVHGIANRNS